MVLLLAGTAKAQQSQSRNLSEIEDSFVNLMRLSATNASNETRQLHLRVLGKAYDQYILAVGNELKILRNLLDAAKNISSDDSDEISKAIKHWEGKKAEATKDIQRIASSATAASSAIAASSASNSPYSHPATPQPEPINPVGANSNPNSTNGTARSSSSNASSSTPGENFRMATICGQVSLASLVKVQALVQAAKSDLKNENLKSVKNKEDFNAIKDLLNDGSNVHHSRLGDVCQQEDWRKLGEQRRSAVRLLRATRSLLPGPKKAGITGANDPDISEDWLQKQVLMLEEYLGNVAVHIRNDNGALIKTAFTDKDGNFKIELRIPAADCDNIAEEKSYGLTT